MADIPFCFGEPLYAPFHLPLRGSVGLVLLGFAGAFRRSELVGLDIEDCAFGKDGLTVTLRRSKTDQEGEGRRAGIPYGSNPETCPVRTVQAWLEQGAIWLSLGAGTHSITFIKRRISVWPAPRRSPSDPAKNRKYDEDFFALWKGGPRSAIASPGWMLGPRHGTPHPLFGARDKTENQFSGHVPPQQPLRISEIPVGGRAAIPEEPGQAVASHNTHDPHRSRLSDPVTARVANVANVDITVRVHRDVSACGW